MATTVTEILEAAYAKSTQNNPGTIATETTELLQVVQRQLDGCFAVAARVNPQFYALKTPVAGVAGVWARPADAESIFRIETTVGDLLVVVVPYDDRTAESGLPGVYEYGQDFYTAGNASDPTGTDSLEFYYSKQPTALTALGDTLDAMWPEQFNELLILDVALYLATKDAGTTGREAEITVLAGERTRWANRYIAFLEHSTANVRHRHSHIRRINTPSLSPIFSIIGAELGSTK